MPGVGEQALFSAIRAVPWRRMMDRLLLVLLVLTAFLLGCYEMADPDIWWHLRGGQWILEHGRVPQLDPFTFGSADKPWVDIHWSYEVVLALVYQAGGVGALVLLASVVGSAAVLAALAARRREWPVAAVVLCWMPALVLLSFRLDPRPELFSLLFLGSFLAVLFRAEERPALIWLLPPLQVLWVNVQGLFVLGPILVGLYLCAHAAPLLWQRLRGPLIWGPTERTWWLHVVVGALAVVSACLVNPYFIDGALFPFGLFPKVADPNNPYKQTIDELMSPRDYLKVTDATTPVAAASWCFLSLNFLLLLLPLSFLFPALWRAWLAAPSGRKPGPVPTTPETPAVGPWLGGLAVALGMTGAYVLVPFASAGVPVWVIALGDYLPLALGLAGAGVALLLRKRSGPAAILLGVGSVAQALWMAWLRSALLGGERGLLGGPDFAALLAVPLAVAGLAAGGLVVRWGGKLFPALLALAFAYLGLQAIQNTSRLALVAGIVLTWNFGEWAWQLAAASKPGRLQAAGAWCLRAGLVLALGLWIAALATDQYYVHAGEPRHFGFRDQPLEFAHEAAVFAGQPDLPERALVFNLGQANVYVFHNAPRDKPFLDGRLEMPDRQTFETYVTVQQWLQQQDPRWEKAVADMGDPLLLVSHQNNFGAEALLLRHPGRRCIYYDAVASVFIDRNRGVPEEQFPTIDFAARHFQQSRAGSVPGVRGAEAREAQALFNLVTALPHAPEFAWRWRIPVLLAALDRAHLALDDDPHQAIPGSCWPTVTGISTRTCTASPPTLRPNGKRKRPSGGPRPLTAFAVRCNANRGTASPGTPFTIPSPSGTCSMRRPRPGSSGCKRARRQRAGSRRRSPT